MPNPADTEPEVREALAVALRHFDDVSTTEHERDSILSAMVILLTGSEAETASRALFHRREAAKQQMQLAGLFSKTL